jgi:LmbE family N-acetylglucosaminyl deacetylase
MNLEQVERALVFAAHPDDEILGVGGTIARLSKQGTKVTGVIFSLENACYSTAQLEKNILEVRKKEARQAAGILGVHEHIFLGKSPQGDVSVYQECIRLIRKYRPQIIFTHFREDRHRDHRTVSEITDEAGWKASENALSDLGKPWHTPCVYYYELSNLFTNPSDIVDITATVESKLKAVKTQTSQFALLPEIMEYSRSLAKVRGYMIGVEYGEAFLLSSLNPCKH